VRNFRYVKQSLSDYTAHTTVMKDMLTNCGQQVGAIKLSSFYDVVQSMIHKSETEIPLK